MGISTVCISIQEFEELIEIKKKYLSIKMDCRLHNKKIKRIMDSNVGYDTKYLQKTIANAEYLGRIKGTVYES